MNDQPAARHFASRFTGAWVNYDLAFHLREFVTSPNIRRPLFQPETTPSHWEKSLWSGTGMEVLALLQRLKGKGRTRFLVQKDFSILG